MKQLLLFSLSLLGTCLLAQQSFSITPNPVFSEYEDDYIEEARAVIKNLLDTTQNFRWKRTIIRLEHDSVCSTAVADPFIHYFPAVSEKNFWLEPNAEGPLEVSLFDFDLTGCCAIVQLKVKSLDVPSDSIEVYYYMRECQPLSVSAIQKSSIKIFPNPATHYFSLENAASVSSMTLCDATGKMVKRMAFSPTNRYGMADLPLGTYYLVLEDKPGRVLQVLEFVKQ